MKKFFVIIFTCIALTLCANAQQTNQQQNNDQNIILQPKVQVNDVAFIISTLNSVEVTGADVDNFLIVKGYLEQELAKSQKENKQGVDSLTLNMPLPNAKVLLSFLSKAKISGGTAVRYKTFVEAFVLAAKNYTPQPADKKKKD